MPTLVTPPVALGFAIQNSGSMVRSPDTKSIEISGLSNTTYNLDTVSTPLKLFTDGGYYSSNAYTYREDGHLYQLSLFQEDEPGSSAEGNKYWTLFKYHPSTGVVRLATGPGLGTYYTNPNAGNSISTTGWTLLNGTTGALRIKQSNPYLSALPSPTTGGVLPSSIPDLKIWLKADAGVTTFNLSGKTYLTSWADQSGSGQLMQRQVNYQGNGLIEVYPNRVNGKPSIAVNGYRTLLLLSPITNLKLGPDTTTLCVNKVLIGDYIYSLGHNQGTNWRFDKISLRSSSYSLPAVYVTGDRYVGDVITNGYFTNMLSGQGLYKFSLCSIISRSTPLNLYQRIINGKSASLAPSTETISVTPGYLSFGAAPYYSEWTNTGEWDDTTPVRGEIAEFIHFNRALTDQELSDVTEGLRLKYALY